MTERWDCKIEARKFRKESGFIGFISSQGLQVKFEFRVLINGIIRLSCVFELEFITYSLFMEDKCIQDPLQINFVFIWVLLFYFQEYSPWQYEEKSGEHYYQ